MCPRCCRVAAADFTVDGHGEYLQFSYGLVCFTIRSARPACDALGAWPYREGAARVKMAAPDVTQNRGKRTPVGRRNMLCGRWLLRQSSVPTPLANELLTALTTHRHGCTRP